MPRWDLAMPPAHAPRPDPPPVDAVAQLVADLARVRAEARDAAEAAAVANEELQTANEELRAAIEELQTANEQLAAGRDDLRAANARLRAQAAELQVLGSDLASLLASTDIAVLFLDPDHRVRRYTPAVLPLIGFVPADVGRPVTDLSWKFDDPDLLADARAVFDRLVPAERPVSAGGRHYLRRVLPYRAAGDRIAGVVVVFVDVTERHALEQQLRQSQKMEAFGQLAGGVAHDFNNLLQVINGYAALALEDLPAADPLAEAVGEIRAAGEKSAALTRQLLAFARQEVAAPRALDLCSAAADAVGMLRRLIGEDVRLDTDLPAGTWPVLADPGQLEQVVVNLAVNARDAMPAGGTLTVACRNETVAAAADAPAGQYAVLSVADTGTGMPPDVAARAFEPFFTTKDVGKGTGLGLATVYGIVKQAGGHVRVTSAVGRGSTFEVYLPRAGDADPPGGGRSGVRARPRGTETVLVIEDEKAVRALVRTVLAGRGYTVLEAGSGAEADRLAVDHRGPVHLVLSDVVMPGAGGRRAVAGVLAKHPEAKVVYMSGYTDDAVVRQGVSAADVPFLQKPFTPAVLAAKVRQVLDAPVH